MKPYYSEGDVALFLGDCVDVMKTLDAASFDSIATDPPYGLEFMGKEWDKLLAKDRHVNYPSCRSSHGPNAYVAGLAAQEWHHAWALEALRVLKPGGHMVAMGGTRTHHRLWCAVEDAGFEIRDCLMWVYGSGFPKSLDVSKAIDKAAGAKREVVGRKDDPRYRYGASLEAASPIGLGTVSDGWEEARHLTAPATDAARQWQGWGTALKPSHEEILLARKPFTISGEQDIIVESLTRLEAQLWSLLPANSAAENFRLSPSGYDEACASAQWSADEWGNTRAALLAQMDMSQFVSVVTTCLNIVMLWSLTLDALLNPANISIIGTGTEQTIDWRTLSLSVSALTPASIIQAEIEAPGSWGAALPAGRYLNAVSVNIASTQELFALAAAISNGQAKCPVEAVQGFQPNHTPILLCRKPIERNVAHNVQKHGTGALNVDGCRIGTADTFELGKPSWGGPHKKLGFDGPTVERTPPTNLGRWPANLVLDEEAAAMLDAQSGETVSREGGIAGWQDEYVGGKYTPIPRTGHNDSGGASRFFYTSKAGPDERGGSKHPTVKPRDLMLWLCKLITPPGGLILDPFIGSGTTAVAARMGGFRCVGIDNNEEYLSHAAERLRLGDEALCEVAESKKSGAEQGVLW